MARGALKNLGALIIGVALALVAVEVATRIYLSLAPAYEDAIYIPDPYAVYRLRPTPADADVPENERINSLGFWDREHPREKPEGTYRILGIGDSFVWGAVPYEDNFLRVAERRLSPQALRDSADVEVVLMGLGGYSPENYVGVMRSLGTSLDPDLVVLCLFVGNDIHLTQVRGELFRGRRYFTGSPNPVLNALRKSRAFVLTESFFLGRIKSALLNRRYQRKGANGIPGVTATSVPDTIPQGRPYIITKLYLHIQSKRLPVFLKEPGRTTRKHWRQLEADLLEFDRLCKEAGAPWILFIIPTEVQVDTEVRSLVLEALSLPEDDCDFDLPQRRLRAFCHEHGITVLDPLPTLRELNRPDARLYLESNTHWNKRGNHVAGEMLADTIAQTAGF